jgi:hypothetical protein
MILHNHGITTWFLVRLRANTRCRRPLRRHQLGQRGWRWRWRSRRRAGVIDQTHNQLLLAIDRCWLPRRPQRQCEQHVQCQYRSQHEHVRPRRQCRLSPAPVTQQTARGRTFPVISALLRTFDDTTPFKPITRAKTYAYYQRVLRPMSVDRLFHQGFPRKRRGQSD